MSFETMRWEQYSVLLGEKHNRLALMDGDTVLGIVRETGGSWECFYGIGVIAYRPDLASAKRAVEAYHEITVGERT